VFNRRIVIPLTDRGEMGAYLALPSTRSEPGIVLLHEIYGMNAAMRNAADELAANGFVVLVPDLFWRLEPGIELGYGDEDRQKAFAYWQRFDNDLGVQDVSAAVSFLRGCPETTGKVAVLGFCLGGKLAIRSAAMCRADAAISFYGVKLEEDLQEMAAASCPLLLHFGGDDQVIPSSTIDVLRRATAGRNDVDIYVYPGARHGFYNVFRSEAHHPAAYDLSRQRSLTFLHRTLGRHAS
jgi:carboxymethylenebutenolidase